MPVNIRKIDKPIAKELERKTVLSMNANVLIIQTLENLSAASLRASSQNEVSDTSDPFHTRRVPSLIPKKSNPASAVEFNKITINTTANSRTVINLEVRIFQRFTVSVKHIIIV